MTITEHAESFEITNSDSVVARKYFYFDDNAKRRQVSGRVSRDKALQDARAYAGSGAKEVLRP